MVPALARRIAVPVCITSVALACGFFILPEDKRPNAAVMVVLGIVLPGLNGAVGHLLEEVLAGGNQESVSVVPQTDWPSPVLQQEADPRESFLVDPHPQQATPTVAASVDPRQAEFDEILGS